MNLRILLADDHRMFRDGLRPLLERRSGWTVVGEAETGRQAVALTEELRPDLVVMDVSMPDLNGIQATALICAEYPDTRVVVLSMHADRRYVVEALKAGARAFVLKDASFAELDEVIATVLAGRLYLSPELGDALIRDYLAGGDGTQGGALALLTVREREVLRLLAEGLGTKEIGARLNISVKTVESHRKNLMDKLEVRTIAGLTKLAIREGLTELE